MFYITIPSNKEISKTELPLPGRAVVISRNSLLGKPAQENIQTSQALGQPGSYEEQTLRFNPPKQPVAVYFPTLKDTMLTIQ